MDLLMKTFMRRCLPAHRRCRVVVSDQIVPHPWASLASLRGLYLLPGGAPAPETPRRIQAAPHAADLGDGFRSLDRKQFLIVQLERHPLQPDNVHPDRADLIRTRCETAAQT